MAATIGTRSAATERHAATAFACAIFSAADSCALIAAVLSAVDGEPDGTTEAGGVKPGGEAVPAGGGVVVPDAAAGGVAALDGGGAPGVGEAVVGEPVGDEAETVGCGGGRGMPLGCGPGEMAGMASPMSDASAIRCCRCSSRSGPNNSTRAGVSDNARSYCATNREVSV